MPISDTLTVAPELTPSSIIRAGLLRADRRYTLGAGFLEPGHDHPNPGRRKELAGTIPAALRELADQILITSADDVRLDVSQTQAPGADGTVDLTDASMLVNHRRDAAT